MTTTEDSGFSSAESPAKKAHKRTNSQIQTETHKKDQAVIDIPPSPVKTESKDYKKIQVSNT